ncbi:MAG TPA: peptidyl-prolyl cis-trans isomerase [Minicystis sp.]|nr:peptidyl-prolyl cis-trans isomerase [Minicystis sp.]
MLDRRAMPAPSSKIAAAVALAAAALLAGCNDGALKPAPDGGTPIRGLTAEQAGRVVAKVGDRAITVAEFAKALDRMDQNDRLRYQSKERRRELLSEMVDVELLAQEARRRGLDKEPETQEQVRQILRDAVLAEARKGVPSPAEITADEVKAYYDAHHDKFVEPERRRVAAIVMSDKKKAEEVLKQALKVKSQTEWGELFGKNSLTAPKKKNATPVELVGDLGIVGPPDDARGSNPNVPEPVRAAAFQIADKGQVLDHLVEADGRYFIVRLNGKTPGHTRSLAEADRSIRVLLLTDRIAAKEKALEDELKKKIPVEIDEKALAGITIPAIPEAPSSSRREGDHRGGD